MMDKTRKTRRKLPKPSDTSPSGWARWWFAMGCGAAGTAAHLQTEQGLSDELSESVFSAMRSELTDEIERLRENIVQDAARLFRAIKGDASADWPARQRAQSDLEALLDLVAFAQHPEAIHDDDIQEAIVFHQLLIAAVGPTPGQKLRSQRRLMQLLGHQVDRGRRARSLANGASTFSRYPPVLPTQGFSPPPIPRDQTRSPDDSLSLDEPPHNPAGSPSDTSDHAERPADPLAHIVRPVLSNDTPFSEAAREQLTKALEQEASELEAEFERVLTSGMSTDEVLELFEPRMHENAMRQVALRQIPVADAPAAVPEPHAQGPPA